MPAASTAATPGAVRTPADARLLAGSAFFWSWVSALYMSALFAPFGRQGVMPEAATWGVSLLGVPICLVFLWQGARVRKLAGRPCVLAAGGAVGTAGTLALIASGQTGSLTLLAAGCLLGAAFMAAGIAAWGAAYCAGGMRTVMLYVAGGYACSLVPNVLFTLLVPPVSAYAFAPLPLLSMGLLAAAPPALRTYAPGVTPGPRAARALDRPTTLRRLLGVAPEAACGLAIVMLGVGYMEHSVSFSASPSLPFLGDGVAVQLVHGAVAAALFAVMRLAPRRASLAYRAGLLLIVAGFLLMPFLHGGGAFWVAGAVIIAGYVAFDVLVWVIVAQSSFLGRADAFVSVCVMRIAVNGTFCSLGGICGAVVSRAGMSMPFPCADAVLAGYLVTVAVMLVLGSRDTWGLFEQPDAGRVRVLSVSEQMQRLADAWGLTGRECEVFELLATGRTQPWVAAHLGISENTVDSHVRRIYAKSGVNSRQELLDLVFPVQSTDSHERLS